MTASQHLRPSGFDAVLFDMDGVVTDTATAHAAAWKSLFDDYLDALATRENIEFQPFDANVDYRKYVDGKPRYDGVRSFLGSRQIELPFGDPNDDPGKETICGLGNRKNLEFNAWLRHEKVRVFPGTIEFIEMLRARSVKVAIFSASCNMDAVLSNAGIEKLFDAKVDGRLMSQLALPGKPDPAMLITAADGVGVAKHRCVVIEDAIAGVEAGHRGAFGFVVGVDRGGYAEALRAHGADLIVTDLSECRIDADGNLELKHCSDLPSIWDDRGALEALLRERRLVVLLDYDGTLTPIVADYRKAQLDEPMRATLRELAGHFVVGVISGRDLTDVRHLVGIDSLLYSGSHGFELAGPDDWHHTLDDAAAYVADLDRAEAELSESLASIPGHAIERKRFAIAVHYRRVDEALVTDVERIVDDVLATNPRLLKGLGKKVIELKPALQWDKGRAVELLLETLDMPADETLALYIGDDVTDEAVFHVLRKPNISIVISEGGRVTAADYTLHDCEDVRRFLEWLSQTVQLPIA